MVLRYPFAKQKKNVPKWMGHFHDTQLVRISHTSKLEWFQYAFTYVKTPTWATIDSMACGKMAVTDALARPGHDWVECNPFQQQRAVNNIIIFSSSQLPAIFIFTTLMKIKRAENK